MTCDYNSLLVFLKIRNTNLTIVQNITDKFQ